MRAPVVFEKHNQSSAQQALFLIALSHLWPAYVDIGEFAAATRGQETAGTSQETAGAPKKKGSFFKRLWHQIRPKTLKTLLKSRPPQLPEKDYFREGDSQYVDLGGISESPPAAAPRRKNIYSNVQVQSKGAAPKEENHYEENHYEEVGAHKVNPQIASKPVNSESNTSKPVNFKPVSNTPESTVKDYQRGFFFVDGELKQRIRAKDGSEYAVPDKSLKKKADTQMVGETHKQSMPSTQLDTRSTQLGATKRGNVRDLRAKFGG